MPEIQAFRGIRYDLGRVGSLSDVVCPPYDVITPQLQEELYRRHPYNFVRLELNRIDPTDDEANNRYTRAGRLFRQWLAEGVLFIEADPAIYVYHQEFSLSGKRYIRRGFMARMRLSRFGEGIVFPHEETMSGPKWDRYMLTAVCKANLSQVFGLYPDPENQAQAILEEAIADQPPLEAVDHLGVVHRMWPVSNVEVIRRVSAIMGPKPVFIADGHHRYETACDWRDQVYDSGALSRDHPANYVLMSFVAMEDAGLVVLPTHRVFAEGPELSAPQLQERLGRYFTVQLVGKGPQDTQTVWEELATQPQTEALALYTRQDRQWSVLLLTAEGREKMAELCPDHSPEWQALSVAILHRLVLPMLGIAQPIQTKYFHLAEEVAQELKTGNFPLAALVQPVSIAQIRSISMTGERLPPKTTYFYPKLLSGLVVNPLE
ncbi:MAG: DUF1015 domain-containing protein [Thermoguttaceae bacterium]|nr:DUF1015 domain-containing protein [Thermoguttaceae bacterium]MDW8038854.1 DUF1015 domain-containing protein [Thermoguttaceae bacterium]